MHRRPPLRFTAFTLPLAMVALALTSCGPRSGSLSGKVTYKGEPLKGGFITFLGPQTYSADIKLDGSYEVPKMVSGTYRIGIDTEALKIAGESKGPPFMKFDPSSKLPKEAKEPPTQKLPVDPSKFGYSVPNPSAEYDPAKRYVKIPAKYKDPNQSGLTYDFPGGTRTYNIELTD